MTTVDQAQWVEVPVDFEIELDRAVCALGEAAADVVSPGVYAVTAMRHWAVVLGEAALRVGETWFRIERDGRPAWVRAAECAPYASETWD